MSKIRTASLISAIWLAAACTDGRTSRQLQSETTPPPQGTTLIPASELQAQGTNGSPAVTNALQMQIRGGSLYMSGRPFGFTRWEIAQDPEDPDVTFAASTQMSAFSPMGAWVVDWYSAGALALSGSNAYLSGSYGTTQISMAETQRPKETQRYPALDPKSDVIPADDAFMYTALVAHPSKALLYGFRKQDFVYTIDNSGAKLKLLSRQAYGAPGQNVCCVMGATVFNNKVYVAFRDKLVFFDIGEDGKLTNVRETKKLNAVNVVSTPKYLYVQHEPTAAPSGGTGTPSGIYVFDSTGKSVASFKASSPKRFAVSEDDKHFYANIDGQRIEVFRIQWTK